MSTARVKSTPPRRERQPETYGDLETLIAARHDKLSSRLKGIAEFALAHPNAMALETVAGIAREAQVPPSALVRFAQALGFDGFSSMQKVFRTRLIEQAPSYADRIRALEAQRPDGDDDVLGHLVATTTEALGHLQEELPAEDLAAAATCLAEARHVVVCGQRRSFPVASYLAYGLLHLKRPAILLDGVGGMTLQQVRAMSEGDVLLAVSFTPYAPETMEIVEAARKAGVRVVAITDLPLSPLARLGDPALFVRDPDIQGLRSLSASMCLAMTLIVTTGRCIVRAERAKR